MTILDEAKALPAMPAIICFVDDVENIPLLNTAYADALEQRLALAVRALRDVANNGADPVELDTIASLLEVKP